MKPFVKHVLSIMTCLLTTSVATPELKLDDAPDSEQAANLLPNSSFEEKTAGGVRGWSSRAWHGEQNCRWSVDSPGRTGGRCVSIQSDKGADAAWTATITIEPNTFYRLSGWIKTKDVRGAVGALLNIQNMQHVKTPRVTGTEDWTRVSTLFQTGGATQLEINCLFGGWGKSTDNVRIVAHIAAVALELVGMKCVNSNPTRTKGLP